VRSIFTDKSIKPTEEGLETALGNTFNIWQNFTDFTKKQYPEVIEEWNFSGEKFGWSYRLKDKKRVLIYLLPRDKFFKVAFVFGQKATDKILQSEISESIKNEINAAKKYAEGRGIRIEIKDKSIVQDIEKLIDIKVSN
jgi:hypothetical protein